MRGDQASSPAEPAVFWWQEADPAGPVTTLGRAIGTSTPGGDPELVDSGKRLAKDLARPFLRPLLARMAHLHERIDAMAAQMQETQAFYEVRAGDLERQLVAIQQTFNEVLDALSMQNALAREARRDQAKDMTSIWEAQARFAEALARTESRLEFVRREVLLEVASGRKDPSDLQAPETEIVDTAKFHARPLRLNLGAGHIPLDEYVNVDGRRLPGVDLVAEVGDLPLEPGSVDEIRSSHLLEHFVPSRLDDLLAYWYRLLAPGGTFRAVVPDAESMIRTFVSGETPWEDLKEVTFGAQEYAGDFHFTMFSHDDLVTTLTDVGFTDVKLVEVGRRNGVCLEMEVVAHKPEHD